MIKYRLSITAIILSFAFLFSSCQVRKPKKISVFYSTYDDGYINSIRTNLDRSFAKTKGTTVENHNADYDLETQIKQIRNAVESGTNLLVINLVSSDMKSIVSIAETAKEGNVPVIFFESPLPWQVSELNKESVIITTDFSSLGKSFGKGVGSYLAENYDSADKNSDGKISYVLYKSEDSILEEYDISKYCVEETDRILALEGKPAIEYYDGTEFGSIVPAYGLDIKETTKESIQAIFADEKDWKTPEVIICTDVAMAQGVKETVTGRGYRIPVFTMGAMNSRGDSSGENTLIIPVRRNEKKVSDAITKVSFNFLNGKDRFKNLPKQYVKNNHLIEIPFYVQ